MLREKFPEFCSSPSPPIEGRERGGWRRGAAPGALPAAIAANRSGARRAQGARGRGLPSLRMDTTPLGRLVLSLRAN